MKTTLSAFALAALTSMPAWSFDLGGLIRETVKNAVTETATQSVQSAAEAQGIPGAGQALGAAASAGAVSGAIGQAQALKGVAGSGPLGALSAAMVARDMAAGTPEAKFKSEYMAIHQRMGQCRTQACIQRYQQEIMALEARMNAYRQRTGDANLDGKVDATDASVARAQAAAADFSRCPQGDFQCRQAAHQRIRAAAAGQAQPAAPAAAPGIGGVVNGLLGSFGLGR